MNTTYRCALAALSALAMVSIGVPASAQLQRNFPQNTLRGVMAFGDFPQVTLNGVAAQLAPGSRVRNPDNLIVTPGSLAGARVLVHYTVDLGGHQVHDVWILRPDEAAIKPWPTTLEEARNWRFDPNTRTWVKP